MTWQQAMMQSFATCCRALGSLANLREAGSEAVFRDGELFSFN